MRDIRDQCRQDVPALKAPKDWSLSSLTGLLPSDLRLPISELRFNHTILAIVAAFAQDTARAHGTDTGAD
jgi:hypothetical protein